MPFLSGLSRSWVTSPLPGARQPDRHVTYASYPQDDCPPAPTDLADLSWLEAAPAHSEDYLASWFTPSAQRDLSWAGIGELWPDINSLPDDFLRFVGVHQPGLRDRLRSATDCYFDLGDELVEVDGGRLMHLVSDSQWVYHWLLYVGDDGDSAMVGSQFPAGFALGPEDRESHGGTSAAFVVVADSFSEFAWRWWMDNEIFYKVAVDHVPLTDDEVRYVQGYGPPVLL